MIMHFSYVHINIRLFGFYIDRNFVKRFRDYNLYVCFTLLEHGEVMSMESLYAGPTIDVCDGETPLEVNGMMEVICMMST